MNGTEIKIRIDKDTVLTRVLPNSEISVADILGLAQSLKQFFRLEQSPIENSTPQKYKTRKTKHFHTLEEIQDMWKQYKEHENDTSEEKKAFAQSIGYKDWYSLKGRIQYWLSKNRIERRN